MDGPPQKRSRGEKHLMALISDIIHPPNQCQSPTEKALAEARRYIDEEPVDEDPLLWWSKNSPRYPNLTVLAKKYLAYCRQHCQSKESMSPSRKCNSRFEFGHHDYVHGQALPA